ncbi:SH3 domain-containing protein [Sphingomonas sp. BK345]|uniref:SH3 domain-containing protein n=1 Tax=Sphingomonas sp. BK345 TaxID=2586980 RepID=UPI0016147F4C|nr:SH3 domain-containing protein [Sphingomonas sp. BK345]MBB3473524.1 hypothetical protein [Sphingomonas sp. BK345]
METYVTTGQVNLRSSPYDPGDDSNKITTLPRGQWVNLIRLEGGGWAEVWTILRNKSYRGYVATSLITSRGARPRSEGPPESPVNRHKLFDEAEFLQLKDFMTIRPPSVKAKPTEALSLSRSREISIDWDYTLSPRLGTDYGAEAAGIPFTRADNISYFASYFIASWGLNARNFDTLKADFLYTGDVDQPVLQRKNPPAGLGVSQFEAVFQTRPAAFALQHRLANRMFLLTSNDQAQPIVAADFADWQAFTTMLSTRLQSATPAVKSPAAPLDAGLFISSAEEVDLGPAIILRQYSELVSLTEFTSSLDKQATELGKQGISGLLTGPEIDALIAGVLKMKSPELERRSSLEILADRASDLGYILNITDSDIKYTYEDATEITIKPGKLYQPYVTRIHWVTEHKRVSEWHDDGFFGLGSSSGRREWTERIQHEREVVKYRDVPVDFDPWTERQDELLKREGLRSYRFEKQGAEYRTAQGDTLVSIIAQCERDETFRRRTAIWLPVYEQSLTKGQVLTKYVIFKRPYRGIMPVKFPRLYVEEALTYRTSWKSSELGDLVYTINLAPGEERTVTIEQKVSKATEETRSTTSILDLTETDTLELSTEIENEAKTSNETTKTSSWSASASGSYGPVGGSVGASGESKNTTAQFARNMERIARKAAHNITRKTQREVRTSTSIKSDYSRSESTTIKIHNINDGRTLNLLFFRLYNLYAAGVYVDNLQMLTESGIEVVAGSGITVPRLFDLYDLENALDVFDLRNLPFPVAAAPGSEDYAKLFNAYWSYILDSLIKLLGKEYSIDIDKGRGERTGMLNFSADFQTIVDAQLAGKRLRLDFGNGADRFELANLYRALRTEIERVSSALAETVEKSEAGTLPLREHELRVASPGLFVDSFMGVRPATEPYAEEMRAQTVRLKSAEAARQQALANYYNSLAGYDGGGASGTRASARVLTANSIAISFATGVVGGSWTFALDGEAKKIVEVEEGQTSVELTWPEEQDWLQQPDDHAYEMQSPDGISIPFIVLPAVEE